MVSEKTFKELEHSSVELTVTVDQDIIKSEYQSLLADYTKKAHIKGFRKGKAPAKVLEQKYGEGIRAEVMYSVIERSLKEILEDKETAYVPLHYHQPVLQNEDELEIDLEKDFSYSVVYDVYPKVEVSTYTGFSIPVPEVQVPDDLVDAELTQLQEQNALVTVTDSPAEEGSIVTLDYCELDEAGEPLEETKREDFTFTVGTGYNYYQLDADVIGLKAGDERTIEKDYPEDHETKPLAGRKVAVKVALKAVKRRDLPELDDDFAQDVSESYETLDDLKRDIGKRIHEHLDARLKEYKLGKVLQQIVKAHEIQLPDSMVRMQLEQTWQSTLQQYRLKEEHMLSILGTSKEEHLEGFRERAEQQIKESLLLNKIIEQEHIEVTDEEVMLSLGPADESADDQAKSNRVYQEMQERERLTYEKATDFLLAASTFTKGEEMSYEDFMNKRFEAQETSE